LGRRDFEVDQRQLRRRLMPMAIRS
jgi:hypothetical protein